MSRVFWAICKSLNKLPNDPYLKKMNKVQLIWCYENMKEDIQEFSKTDKDSLKFGMNDKEFEKSIEEDLKEMKK